EDIEHRGARDCGRRIEVVGPLRTGAGEIDPRAPGRTVDRDPNTDHGAVIHLVGELTIVQNVEHAADRLRGMVLDVLHVGVDHGQPEVTHHAPQLIRTLGAGGYLCLQIRDV